MGPKKRNNNNNNNNNKNNNNNNNKQNNNNNKQTNNNNNNNKNVPLPVSVVEKSIEEPTTSTQKEIIVPDQQIDSTTAVIEEDIQSTTLNIPNIVEIESTSNNTNEINNQDNVQVVEEESTIPTSTTVVAIEKHCNNTPQQQQQQQQQQQPQQNNQQQLEGIYNYLKNISENILDLKEKFNQNIPTTTTLQNNNSNNNNNNANGCITPQLVIQSSPSITNFINELTGGHHNGGSNSSVVVNNGCSDNENWRSMYLLVNKQLELERIRNESLETLLIQRDQEVQNLKEQLSTIEVELEMEKNKLHKTFGTIRNGTKKLTIKFGHDIDVTKLLEELNSIEQPSYYLYDNGDQNQFDNINGNNANEEENSTNNNDDTQSNNSNPTTDNSNISNETNNKVPNGSEQQNNVHPNNKKEKNHHQNKITNSNSESMVTLSATSYSPSSSIVNSASNSFEFSSEALMNRLNSYHQSSGSLKLSASNSSISSFSSTRNASLHYSKRDIKKIILIQSLVRRWLCKKRFKKLRLKRAVVEEFYETETTYVAHISHILKIFVNPLKQKLKSSDSIINADEIDQVFSTIDIIYKSNCIFLDTLEEIYRNFNKWSCFGEKLLEHLPLFECYIDYIINYEYSQKALKKTLQMNQSFSQFVKTAEQTKELDDLDLSDLLIMPVQRIPRYIMLLKEIRKYTPTHHSDYHPIDRALDAFKHFADNVNEKNGSRKKVLLLEDKIFGFKDDITGNSRYLIKEGPLKFKKNNEHVFLFSDMIMICHPSFKKVKRIGGSNGSNGSNGGGSGPNSGNNSPNSSSPNLGVSGNNNNNNSTNHQNSDLEVTYKYLAKINLDARLKIIQDQNEPKFSILIPDHIQIELVASNNEERTLWIQTIFQVIQTIIIPNSQSIFKK
eukprot:gene6038-7522_t